MMRTLDDKQWVGKGAAGFRQLGAHHAHTPLEPLPRRGRDASTLGDAVDADTDEAVTDNLCSLTKLLQLQ